MKVYLFIHKTESGLEIGIALENLNHYFGMHPADYREIDIPTKRVRAVLEEAVRNYPRQKDSNYHMFANHGKMTGSYKLLYDIFRDYAPEMLI